MKVKLYFSSLNLLYKPGNIKRLELGLKERERRKFAENQFGNIFISASRKYR